MDGAVRALTTPNSPDHAGEMEHRPSALSLSLSLSLGCTLYLPLYADVRQSRLSRHAAAPENQRHPRVRRRLWRRLLQRVASDIDDSSNSFFC